MIAVMARSHYVELSWLGVGVVVCLLYAILYYVRAKFLNLSVSLGLSLLHLLIRLSAVFGLGQLHYIGLRTEQNPTSYNPALAFLDVTAPRRWSTVSRHYHAFIAIETACRVALMLPQVSQSHYKRAPLWE